MLEMPNGDVLYVGYNRETDSLDVGEATNAGIAVLHSFPYDHETSLDANLQRVNEKLNDMEEYRVELQEAEYGGGMRGKDERRMRRWFAPHLSYVVIKIPYHILEF